MELRDQSQRYEVPHSEDRIADIMVRPKVNEFLQIAHKWDQ